MRRRGIGLGLAVAAALGASVAARGEEPAARAEGGASGGSCDLPRVTDRSKVSSLRCIGCHDGTTGPGASFEMGRGLPGQSMSHPVEVDYAAALLRDAARYVPEALLPPDVPLVEGMVSCTSCHDGASKLAKHVVDPARLCYACHRM